MLARARGAGDAGVDLDEEVLEALRVERELHVAAALDAEGADYLQRAVAQHLVLAVGQRLAGRDDYAVAGVYADGVDVLHVADRDGRIRRVAHDLVLYLLVAADALLDQHLVHRRDGQRVLGELAQLFFVVGEAASRAAERERRA